MPYKNTLHSLNTITMPNNSYYKYYSLVLVALSFNYSILLDAIRPNASIVSILLV